MGRRLPVVSRDTFMPVIYCAAGQALLREPLRGPAHSVAPCGNSFITRQDGRGGGGVACSNQLCNLQFVIKGRWGNAAVGRKEGDTEMKTCVSDGCFSLNVGLWF